MLALLHCRCCLFSCQKYGGESIAVCWCQKHVLLSNPISKQPTPIGFDVTGYVSFELDNPQNSSKVAVPNRLKYTLNRKAAALKVHTVLIESHPVVLHVMMLREVGIFIHLHTSHQIMRIQLCIIIKTYWRCPAGKGVVGHAICGRCVNNPNHFHAQDWVCVS